MITRTEAIDVARQFIENGLPRTSWFEHVESHLKATVLYGSVAKGTNRDDSDIDVLLIVPLAIEERYTTGEYFYDYRGQTMDIVLRSIERLRTIADEATDLFQKEVFRDCEIIAASDDEAQSLLNKIASI